MDTKNARRIGWLLPLFLCLGCVLGCSSLPTKSMDADFYVYDYELLLSFTESSFPYQQSGMQMYQDYTKRASNVVVLMQDGGFVEPDYGYLLEISPSGKISSPDNYSVTGRCSRDGTFYWQGVEETGGALRNILVEGRLTESKPEQRASSRFDGSFVLTDPGTGRQQQVVVHDGLYFWEYTEPQEGDLQGWPLVVQPDGSVASEIHLLTRSGITGMYDMTYATEMYSDGKVGTDGAISMQSMVKTLGTGAAAPQEEKFTYVSAAGSQQLQERLGERMIRLLSDGAPGSGGSGADTAGSVQEKANPPPLWFVADMDDSGTVVYGRGMKVHEDRSMALTLAEAAAVAEAVAAFGLQIKRESHGVETQDERRLYELVETAANRTVDYQVVNSHYDSETAAAYVLVEAHFEP